MCGAFDGTLVWHVEQKLPNGAQESSDYFCSCSIGGTDRFLTHNNIQDNIRRGFNPMGLKTNGRSCKSTNDVCQW